MIVALIAMSGCSLPLPEGVPLANADAAARAVLGSWGVTAAPPAIWGVPSNCSVEVPGGTAYGFMDDGACRGGMSDKGGDIYVLLHPRVTYADVLAHELVHWLNDDPGHRRPGLWGAEGSDTLEGQGEAFLRGRPELNVMVPAQ